MSIQYSIADTRSYIQFVDIVFASRPQPLYQLSTNRLATSHGSIIFPLTAFRIPPTALWSYSRVLL